jgi:RHS repeat-associated protein
VARLNPLFDNPILFTSREFDAEKGLYYNRARYLDPTTGRWTTQDPLGFAAGDANLYRYVGNRATMATDPSGNLAWFVAVPLVMSVGGFTWLTGSTALVSYRTTGSWWDAGTWGACWDGLRLGIQANVNGLASAARSLLTLGVWNEPWEVWVVDEVDRPYYNDAFLAARFGWELLPTAGIGRLTQAPGQMGRWGRWALGWDAGQNTVQASRGGWDISQHGLTWGNGLQVVGSLLGLGGNYATWRRLPAGGAQANSRAAVEALADSYRGLPSNQRPSTVALLETSSGAFVGRSGFTGQPHPVVQQVLDSMPLAQRASWHGRCAEVDAISQALLVVEARTGQPITTIQQAQQAISGSTIQTARVRSATSPNAAQHGTAIPPCDSCQPLLDVLGILYR